MMKYFLDIEEEQWEKLQIAIGENKITDIKSTSNAPSWKNRNNRLLEDGRTKNSLPHPSSVRQDGQRPATKKNWGNKSSTSKKQVKDQT